MVDPVLLSIGAVVAAMVVKAAEASAETMAENGTKALGRIVSWLRDRFSHNDSDEMALARVEDAPDSPSRVVFLAEVIDRRATSDASFRTKLEELIGEAKAAEVDMKAISQVAEGIGIVQITHTENSTIMVSQGPASAPVTSLATEATGA